jgi:DNA-binding NtrC family response regulator
MHHESSRSQLIGESRPMLRLHSVIDSISSRACTVLIRGESGTGKELVARNLHARSARADKPFVAVDCTTLKESLFESQLFGHTKGAFTGAEQATLGFIRSAEGGTLFLDEIGEMALPIQAKLLRCIQDRAVVPLGSSTPLPVDVRIMVATHRDLRAMVKRGEFREDLYFRLNVVQLIVPPLRERRSDILLLAHHFLSYFAEIYGESARTLSPEAVQILQQYTWPGNVRELANAMEQLHILAEGDEIAVSDFSSDLQPHNPGAGAVAFSHDIPTLDHAERTLVAKALTASRGNQSRAAEILDIDRRRLRRKIRLYGLQSLLNH